MTIKGEILKKAVRSAGMTVQDAANKLGMSRQMLYIYYKIGELEPDLLQNVREKLGIDLHNVKENVIQSPSVQYQSIDKVVVAQNKNRRKGTGLIPFYNADFMAGIAETYYEDETIYPEYYMDVPEFYGCMAFRAYSDSMESKIRSGNILFGTKLDDWRSHLEFGQIYGITCTDGRRYLKYIRRNLMNEDYFLLKSENSNYDDFTIPKDKINNIWLIEGWLIKNS